MSIFKRLFGKNEPPPPPPAPPQPEPPKDPANDPNLIRVYDSYGREMFITKDRWRTDVLLGAITSNWDKPDELYHVIVGALHDGFRADVVHAAEHLHKTDTDADRGACVWGIVLMEEGRLDEADRVQLLAVRFAAMDGAAPAFLSAPRAIMDGNIELCLSAPKNATTRVLLVQTWASLRHTQPQVAAEFDDKITRLTREHPLDADAQRAIQQLASDSSSS